MTRMETKDELKEFEIKNCTCYYFDEMMRVRDINLNFIIRKTISNNTKIFNWWNFMQNFYGFNTTLY